MVQMYVWLTTRCMTDIYSVFIALHQRWFMSAHNFERAYLSFFRLYSSFHFISFQSSIFNRNFSFGRMSNLSSISLNSKCLFNLFLVIRFCFVGFSDINMKSIVKMGDCFGIFGYWRSILWVVSHFLMVFCMCKWFGSVHFDSKPHTYSIFHISFFFLSLHWL